MEYRGKSYTILQGVGPHSWKWSVRLDDKTVKSNEAPTRAAAKNSVGWPVDKTLAKLQKPPAWYRVGGVARNPPSTLLYIAPERIPTSRVMSLGW